MGDVIDGVGSSRIELLGLRGNPHVPTRFPATIISDVIQQEEGAHHPLVWESGQVAVGGAGDSSSANCLYAASARKRPRDSEVDQRSVVNRQPCRNGGPTACPPGGSTQTTAPSAVSGPLDV